MVDLSAWLADNADAPIASERAVDAWRRIHDKPTSIVVNRDGATLSAQTVRIEYSESERVVTGEASGISTIRDVIVYGVKGHSTIANTDLKYGDRFAYDGGIFRVLMVISLPGEIQANAEAIK